jgi:hypothetical protein
MVVETTSIQYRKYIKTGCTHFRLDLSQNQRSKDVRSQYFLALEGRSQWAMVNVKLVNIIMVENSIPK